MSAVETTVDGRPSRMAGRWPAYLAAAWSTIFAILHIVWASGWYVGLQEEFARKVFARRWFLIYDLVVAVLCVVAALVAMALVHPAGPRRQRIVRMLAWSGTALLVLRGGAGVAQTIYFMASGRRVQSVFWDVWFCTGALLFALACWRFARGVKVRA